MPHGNGDKSLSKSGHPARSEDGRPHCRKRREAPFRWETQAPFKRCSTKVEKPVIESFLNDRLRAPVQIDPNSGTPERQRTKMRLARALARTKETGALSNGSDCTVYSVNIDVFDDGGAHLGNRNDNGCIAWVGRPSGRQQLRTNANKEGEPVHYRSGSRQGAENPGQDICGMAPRPPGIAFGVLVDQIWRGIGAGRYFWLGSSPQPRRITVVRKSATWSKSRCSYSALFSTIRIWNWKSA